MARKDIWEPSVIDIVGIYDAARGGDAAAIGKLRSINTTVAEHIRPLLVRDPNDSRFRPAADFILYSIAVAGFGECHDLQFVIKVFDDRRMETHATALSVYDCLRQARITADFCAEFLLHPATAPLVAHVAHDLLSTNRPRLNISVGRLFSLLEYATPIIAERHGFNTPSGPEL